MKFTTFLKIFAISFSSLIGAFAIGYGIMFLAGSFSEPEILPTEINFELAEYNVDGDFKAKVTTPDEKVTIKDLELKFSNPDVQFEEKDGFISDGIVSIPKYAKIGEEFTITLEKNENEIDGLAWIKGGHSRIKAVSFNKAKNELNTKCNSTHTDINIDVPVYAIEVITKVAQADADANKFVVGSLFESSLKFIPERSAYQFSYDGQEGYPTKLKTAYFAMQSNSDSNLTQVGTTNKFTANTVGKNSTIMGYCFTSTIFEQNLLELYKDKDEVGLRNQILEDLKNGSNKEISERTAVAGSKKIDVVAITVDTVESEGKVDSVNVNEVQTLYVNKNLTSLDTNSSNLGIKLSSQSDTSVSMQSKLNNVAIRFLIRENNEYIDIVNTEGYKFITLENNYFSKSITIGQGKEAATYYFPVITDDINNYHWNFAINQEMQSSLIIEIVYIDKEEIVGEKIQKSFESKKVLSEMVSWNLTNSERQVKLKIDDNENVNEIIYEEYDLKPVTQIPAKNQYKTTRFFAYTEGELKNGKKLNEFIYAKDPVTYVINGSSIDLYELSDGVVKSKTVEAHGISFKVLFMTVQTNHKGEILYTHDGLYKIDQYSKDLKILDNSVSAITFNVVKTLKTFVSHLSYNGQQEDFIYSKDTNSFAFVQGSVNPFDVVISYGDVFNKEENAIFKDAIENDNEIEIVVKTQGIVTDILNVTAKVPDIKGERTLCRYTMTIGSLPTGMKAVNVQLFVRYHKTAEYFVDFPVNMEFPDLNEFINKQVEGGDAPDATVNNAPRAGGKYVVDYIEVYDGAAEVFKFNINYLFNELNKNPITDLNRVKVSSVVEKFGDGALAYAGSIKTMYTCGEKDQKEEIVDGLFKVENEEITGKVAVRIRDKHNRIPILAKYRLESSDKNIMIVSGESFTFINKGKANLNLVNNETNEIEDVLYLESSSAGSMTKVSTLNETIENYKSIKDSNIIFNSTIKNEVYDFNDTINISIYGYKGSEINLRNLTQNDDVSGFVPNLLEYKYKCDYVKNQTVGPDAKAGDQYQEGVEISLLNLMRYEFVKTSDIEDLRGLINEEALNDISKAQSFKIIRNFGETKIIQLRVNVKELGISQLVTIEIKPNVTVKVEQPSSSFAKDVHGTPHYRGLFAETVYTINATISYKVIEEEDLSKYLFYIYNDEVAEQQITLDSPYAKIVSAKSEFVQTPDNTSGDGTSWKEEIQIIFDSPKTDTGFQKFVFDFRLENGNTTNYDAREIMYINVNPNIKAVVSHDNKTLLLNATVSDGQSAYGNSLLFDSTSTTNPITISKIVSVKDDPSFDATKLTFKVLNASGFETKEYSITTKTGTGEIFFFLNCFKPLDGIDTILVEVYYYNYMAGVVELRVSPNIQIKKDSPNWVKYGVDDEYNLKLVNGENHKIKVKDIIASFDLNPDELAGATIDILPKDTTRLIISDITNPDGEITVSGVTDRIYLYSEKGEDPENRFRMVLTLKNGFKLTFKVILLPVDVPFVNYNNMPKLTSDINISDLLLITKDVNWLIEQGYYYTITKTVNDVDNKEVLQRGTPIAFPHKVLVGTEDKKGPLGVQYIDGASYKIDKGEYAEYIDNKVDGKPDDSFGYITTNPVGEDTYIILRANLNEIANNPLVIPYLIKIKKELSLKVFYPYSKETVDAFNQVSNVQMKNLDATYTREYLTFDENNQAIVNFVKNQDINVPNKSVDSSRRVAVFRENNEYSSPMTELKFEVTKLYCTSTIDGSFMQISDVSRYAKFGKAQDKGILTITSPGANTKVRVEVKITSGPGLEGYYYVSVGEIPEGMILKNSQGGSFEHTITANTKAPILEQYTLTQYNKEDNVEINLTDLLHFYTSTANKLKIDEVGKFVKTDPTTNNWDTTMVVYTKYGYLTTAKIYVNSNYQVKLQSESYKVLKSGQVLTESMLTKDIFEAYVTDTDGSQTKIPTFSITKISIARDPQDLFPYEKYINIVNKSDKDKSAKIIIGAVVSDVKVTFKIDFNLGKDPEGKEIKFTYNYDVTIVQMLDVATYNEDPISTNNKYELNVKDVDNITLSLDKLFKINKFEIVSFEEWVNNIEQEDIGFFRATIMSEVELKNQYLAEIQTITEKGEAEPKHVIVVDVPEVVHETTVSFKVEFVNKFNKDPIFTSYFVFTLHSVISVSLNYPQANKDQENKFDCEYFFAGDITNGDMPKDIKLNAPTSLSSINRVTLSDDNKADRIFISVDTLNPKTEWKANQTPRVGSGEDGTPQAKYIFDTAFNFSIKGGVEDTIKFTIYYNIVITKDKTTKNQTPGDQTPEDQNSEDHFFPIATYIVQAYTKISNVWNVKTINYNTKNNQNSSANQEIIYIGSKDDIIQRVQVLLELKLDTGFTLEQDTYLRITQFLGVAVTHQPMLIQDGIVQLTSIFLETLNLKQSTDPNKFYNMLFVVEDADGKELVSVDKTHIKVIVKEVNTRISLYYGGQVCDVYKMFNIINVADFSDTEKSIYPIKVNKEYQVGMYYSERIIDIKFASQEISLKTGESVSLLASNSAIKLSNHTFLLKMRHISNNKPYVFDDIVQNEILLFIDSTKTQGNDPGYLKITPLTRRTADGQEIIYDFIFLAMGAPNESVEVTVYLSINIGETQVLSEFRFMISNDYKNLSKKNSDMSSNTQIDRNKIYAKSTSTSDNKYKFATAGSKVIGNDFVFIEHSNDIDGGVKGNIAPYFSVTYDNAGQAYILQQPQSDKNRDLWFMFTRTEFGNVNIDLIFKDSFGYTFTYYITLVAKYNPVYNGGNVTIYEQDKLKVADTKDSDTGSNLLRIKFEKDDETIADLTVEDEAITISEFIFKFNVNKDPDVLGKGKEQTLTVDTKTKSIMWGRFDEKNKWIETNIKDEYGQIIDIEPRTDSEHRYMIYFSILPEIFYSLGTNQIKGKASLGLNYNNTYIRYLDFTLIIKQLYTIQTVDETVYVRDSTPFSLVDVVEVVNNKNSVKVGDKSLSIEDTAKIEYSLKRSNTSGEFPLGNVPTDSNSDFAVSLGIKAYDKASGKYTTMPLTNTADIETYTSLQTLFGIDSIHNFEFSLVFWDPEGQVHDFVYKKTTNPYKLKASSDSNQKNGESEIIYFYGYYRYGQGESSSTIPTKYVIKPQSVKDDDTFGGDASTGGIKYKINKAYYYTLQIKDTDIIKDQILTLGSRKIENYKSSKIAIYLKNGANGYKILYVNCDEASTKHISLYQAGMIKSGQYTDFYTGTTGSKNPVAIINGMTETDRAKLKDIRFLNDQQKEQNSAQVVLEELYREPGKNEDSYDLINGVKIYYGFCKEPFKVHVQYGKKLGQDSYIKDAELILDLKITLKYIAVNKELAYGSGSLRYATKFKNNDKTNEIELSSWSGTTGNRPFTLVTGYSSATSYAVNSESLTFTKQIPAPEGTPEENLQYTRKEDLEYRINSTESGQGAMTQFATIDKDSGKITTGKNFSFRDNYLAIDIGIKYNNKNNTKYVDTVKIGAYKPQIDSVKKNFDKIIVKQATEDNKTVYKINSNDLLNLITVVDTNQNSWSGDQLTSLFKDSLELKLVQEPNTPDDVPEPIDIFQNIDSVITSNTDKIVLQYAVNGVHNIVEGFKNIDYRYAANCMMTENLKAFDFAFTDKIDIGQIMRAILSEVKFKDIYNKQVNISYKSGIPNTEGFSNSNKIGYIYSFLENKDGVLTTIEANKLELGKTYFVKFSFKPENADAYDLGVVEFNTYLRKPINYEYGLITIDKKDQNEIIDVFDEFYDDNGITYYKSESTKIITISKTVVEGTVTGAKIRGIDVKVIEKDGNLTINVDSITAPGFKLQEIEVIEFIYTPAGSASGSSTSDTQKVGVVFTKIKQTSFVAKNIYEVINQVYGVRLTDMNIVIEEKTKNAATTVESYTVTRDGCKFFFTLPTKNTPDGEYVDIDIIIYKTLANTNGIEEEPLILFKKNIKVKVSVKDL